VIIPEDLKAKTEQLIWNSDLDAFIEKHYGRPWSMQQNGMFGQMELVPFEVGFEPDNKYSIESVARVQAWLESPIPEIPGRLDQPGVAESVDIYTDDILRDLCRRGLLPEGEYTIHVWW
jgi:hypothetical protein